MKEQEYTTDNCSKDIDNPQEDVGFLVDNVERQNTH